jgi:hypothetical protein
MPDYKNGKIYKIVGGGLTYIGSTTQTLNARFIAHKCEKKLRPNKKCSSFELLDYDDCKIELIENYSCENNNQLRERERYWYNLIENKNTIKPLRTNDEIKEYQKEYQKHYVCAKGDGKVNKLWYCGRSCTCGGFHSGVISCFYFHSRTICGRCPYIYSNRVPIFIPIR